jgi:O-antigen/teichoic acid export membrane protein
VAFFTALCTLGLNSVMVKDFVDHPDEQGEALGSAIVMRLASSILSSIMMIALGFLLDGDEPVTIAVIALCSLSPIFNVFDIFHFWFQNQYKSKITSIASFLAYCMAAAYKVVLLITQKSVQWFAFATSIDCIVVAVFLFAAYKRYGGPRLKFSLKKSKSLLHISYHYILSSMMVVIYGQTDKLMLKQMINESEVGFYATAASVCAMWTFVLQAIIDSIYPSILRLKHENQEAYEKKNRQLYAIVFYVSCFVSFGFLVLGKLVIWILYGEAYLPAVPVLRIITWYTAFSYLGVARNAWIVSEEKQKYLAVIYIGAAISNVALNFCLIPVFGAVGAAVASLIAQIFTSILLPFFIKELRPNAKLMLEAIILKDVFNKKQIVEKEL